VRSIDYLECSQLMLARIQQTVPDTFRHIAAESTIERVLELKDYYPAAFVMYPGRAAADGDSDTVIRLQQPWVVALCFPAWNYDSGGGVEGNRMEAGPIIGRVLAALSGWKPSRFHEPLQFVGDERFAPEIGADIYGLIFQTRTTLCLDEEAGPVNVA
jgi:hypothetical protein